MADNANIDATQLSGLEKQVDELIKNIDDVLKLGGNTKGPNTDFHDQKGSGKENLKDWKRPEKTHTQQKGSAVRNMVPGDDQHTYSKSATDDEGDDVLGKAAELLGIEKADLMVSLMALEKAKKKPAFLDNGGDDGDDGDDGEDDGDDNGDASNPSKTKKAAPAEDAESSVVIEGERINKADVGEAVFNVLKKQSEKIDTQSRDIQKAKDEAEMERLRKRADDQFLHVPGTTQERAEMLKAVSGMPESLRKHFEKVLTSAEKLAKSRFDTIGIVGGKSPEEMQKTRQDFENKISEIAKRDSCSRTDALTKARKEDPDGFNAYQGNGN